MALRQGRTKSILHGSEDSALLAVEVYNKPRTSFRTQAFISLMIIAWTRLFHAYFHKNIGNKYYYKKPKTNRYEIVDGEKRTWNLSTCISKYGELSAPVKANLNLFIKLRNKIEHRHIEKKELDILLFGECQSLLMNYENLVIDLFGQEYALHENLVYALQFSSMRTTEQETANRHALSVDLKEIQNFVMTYRESLQENTYNSQSYSVKLIQIPKISNTNRNDVAIEFVRWDELNADYKKAYSQLDVLIKDRVVKQSVVHHGGMKPGKILKKVKETCGITLSHYDHKRLCVIFKIRPDSLNDDDPFKTNTKYCHYDEVHEDYVYSNDWADMLVDFLNASKMDRNTWRDAYKHRRKYDINDCL